MNKLVFNLGTSVLRTEIQKLPVILVYIMCITCIHVFLFINRSYISCYAVCFSAAAANIKMKC